MRGVSRAVSCEVEGELNLELQQRPRRAEPGTVVQADRRRRHCPGDGGRLQPVRVKSGD